ncbi:membrane protein [Tsuneonella deserti]|uniref:Membrane protein n=1 Tax=Tsuneonella deserti TaxID=2035528 RepID=A0ABQ1S7E1_9SPHN|nr:DUF1206 domain-containing protein [Tsuneonella deserti]GGD93704.1 membrane protein [Tsuneonella deserti]
MTVDKSQGFITLVRLGYAARGLVYILLGYIAVSTAGEARAGASSAFDYLQEVPLGSVLLWVVAVGLLAYALFKFISALGDIQHRGSEPKGVVKRVGDFASGVAHLFLAYAAWQFASGATHSADGGQSQEMAGSLLDWQIGALALGLVGVGFLVGAFMQAKSAITASFMNHIDGRAPTGVEAVGRAGSAARAIVFALIGLSLVQSAWLSQSGKVKGLGEAIMALRDNGPLYTLVAIGLMLFGAFSLVTARYRIIPDFSRKDLKPKL